MSKVTEPLVLFQHDSRGVVTLTLNRPDAYNALSEGMLAALAEVLDEIATDESVRVVLLAGAGPAFCAGHDLKEMQAPHTLDYYESLFAKCGAIMMSLQRLPVPVIARVHGMATAAGCQIVGMCDLAVASTDARFAVSGINVGLFCSTPSVALLRNVPRKAAFEMLVTGDFISAEEACERGLINRVVSPTELDAEIETLVASIVSKPRESLALGKALFYRQVDNGIEAAYADAAATMANNMMQACARDGVQAFLDRKR